MLLSRGMFIVGFGAMGSVITNPLPPNSTVNMPPEATCSDAVAASVEHSTEHASSILLLQHHKAGWCKACLTA
jgi:hypothetical protein